MQQKNSISDTHLIFLVCFFTTMSFFAVDLITPALPGIMNEFNTNVNHIQSIMLFYILGLILSQFFYGILGDRFGRRVVVIVGTVIYLAGNALAANATTVTDLNIARFICAFGAGAGMMIGRVIFRDSFNNTKLLKTNSYFSMSINIALATAPLIGGFIQQMFGWRWAFIMLCIWSVLSLVILVYNLPETLPKENRISVSFVNIIKTYRNILSNRDFVYCTLLSGTCLATNLCYLLMSPFLYQLILKLTPIQNGLVYTGNVLGFLFGAILVARLSHRYSPYQFIRTGLIVSAVSNISMLSVGLYGIINPWVLLLPASFNSIGCGLMMPSLGTLTLNNIQTGRGSAAALITCIRQLVLALCSFLAIVLDEYSQVPMAKLMVSFTVGGCVIYWLFIRFRNNSTTCLLTNGLNRSNKESQQKI